MKLTAPDRAALRDVAGRAAPRGVRRLRRSLGVETATRRWLLGGVVPLWLGAGLADWYCHRRTRIEETSGAHESVIHSLMMAEAGAPVMLGLFCDVNAGVLATCAGALGVHSLTAYWDVSYAEERRKVTPVEQHIHSLLEVVPLMATGFLAVLHWDEARALVGRGVVGRGLVGRGLRGRGWAGPDFALRAKRDDPLSGRTKVILIGAMTLLGALPYAEEMVRCLRARPTFEAQPELTEPEREAVAART